MNNPNNLFNMMQTGGLTSTAGGTALARVLQAQKDRERLERQRRIEAKRQKKGSTFGSIGRFAGGLLGAALAPITGGASLAIGAGLGAGLGTRIGEGLGAGKTKKYDKSGTVFYQQELKDVQQASRDYTRDMGRRALGAGLDTAASVYFNPSSMYKESNPFRKGYLARTFGIGGDAYASKVTEQALADNPLLRLENLGEDVFDVVDGIPVDIEGNPINTTGLLSKSMPTMADASNFDKNVRDYFQSKPLTSYMDTEKVAQPSLPKGSLLRRTRNTLSDIKNLGLARTLGIGGKNFAEDVTRQGILDNAGLLLGDPIDPYLEFYETGETSEPNMQASLLGLRDKVNQYNNPIGFQDGGYTAKAILQEAGFTPSEEQLGLFQQFDPGEIERAKESTEQSLLSMTGGMGLSSMGGGFGARQRAATSAIGRGEDLIGDTIEQSQRDFESQTLGTMADLVASGAEFDKDYSYRTNVPTDNPSWSPPPMPSEGATYNFGGQNYIYNGSEWLTEYEFYADEQAGQD